MLLFSRLLLLFLLELAISSGQVCQVVGMSLYICNMGAFSAKLVEISINLCRDGVPPYAHVELPQLMLQQRYAISVDLELPATEVNLALGNFMTSILMLSPKNKTLAYVRRPVCASTSLGVVINSSTLIKRRLF